MTQTIQCEGLLFDLDGTLIDSLPAVNRAWTTWSLHHGLEPSSVLGKIHGRKAIDSVRLILPEADAEAEELYLRELEARDTAGVVALPGAHDFLMSLPSDRWGIVTSGTSDVALSRLRATGLPIPKVLVFGEDVLRGKPNPDPYLLGVQRLGILAESVVAFEDTDAGLASIRAASVRPIGVGIPCDPMIYHYNGLSFRPNHSGSHSLTLA